GSDIWVVSTKSATIYGSDPADKRGPAHLPHGAGTGPCSLDAAHLPLYPARSPPYKALMSQIAAIIIRIISPAL
uniref:hypothetical protein n=1 Tax=Phaeobacter italicus TaxID=481446 RepID=UPI002FDD483C